MHEKPRKFTELSVGQRPYCRRGVKVSVKDLLKEFGAIAAAIEDDCDAPFPDQNAHLFQEGREHLQQTGIGLGRDDEQRVTRVVVTPSSFLRSPLGGHWLGF